MTDEILRNGVAHKVTTSKVTNNAVLPQNILKDEAAALHTNDPLTTTKSHIQDNIQALKNLALSDNWQNVATDKFSDNIQSLGTSRFERAAPNLATFDATEPSHLSSDELKAQAAAAQKLEQAHLKKHRSDEDSEFQKRVKRLKRHVRDVDHTLHNLDPEK